MSKETYSEIKLILLNGEIIVISVSNRLCDEFWEDFFNCNPIGLYYVGNWVKVKATYKGLMLNYINMANAAGIL